MTDVLTVARVIEKLPSRFQPEAAKSLEAVFQFVIEDDAPFYITIANETCNTQMGEHTDPSVTLFVNTETFIRVVTGEQDGMSAFMKGQLRAEGNVMLATKLGKLFKK